jgi:hypothetical protein
MFWLFLQHHMILKDFFTLIPLACFLRPTVFVNLLSAATYTCIIFAGVPHKFCRQAHATEAYIFLAKFVKSDQKYTFLLIDFEWTQVLKSRKLRLTFTDVFHAHSYAVPVA